MKIDLDLRDLVDGPWNESGVADRVVRVYPDKFRFRPGLGWMIWRSTHWQQDRAKSVIEAVATTVDLMVASADYIDPTPGRNGNSLRDTWLKWCRGLGNTTALYNVAKRLESWPSIVVTDGWDADPYVLNHLGGTVHLKTGETHAHRPADLITRCAPAKELPIGFVFPGDGATGSRWAQFLEEIFPDPDLRAYYQRAVGCSVVGRQADHVLFMATGNGGNGKGAGFRAIGCALGEYYSALPANMLIETQQQTHPTEIADLFGRRLCVSAELPVNKKLDETKVKELTGGDRLKARYIAKDFFEFDASHTLWICCNRKPRIVGTDNGIWRRLKVIPFLTTIPPDQRDRWLDEKLESEKDIILTWVIEGARAYLASGLGTCEAVDAATGDYRASEDTLQQALTETCELDPALTESSAEIHKAITRWYQDMGLMGAPNQIVLGRELSQRGYDSTTTGTQRRWRGLSVRPEWKQTEAQNSWQGRRHWND